MGGCPAGPPLSPVLLADAYKITFLGIEELISSETSTGIQQSTGTS